MPPELLITNGVLSDPPTIRLGVRSSCLSAPVGDQARKGPEVRATDEQGEPAALSSLPQSMPVTSGRVPGV